MNVVQDVDILVEDIAYRQREDGRPLLARLYRPARGAGPFPAVVEVHGGAWTGSDRLNNAAIASDFARHGIVTLSLDFRMPPEAAYPTSLADINHGIRWMKAHAARFGCRADRIGSIATGKQADLVVIDGNPSAMIADVRRVELVFKQGIGFDPAKLIDSVRGQVGLW